MDVVGEGRPGASLSIEEARDIVGRGLPDALVDGRRILVLTPDATRTAPLPMMVEALAARLGPRAARLDFMVALGTHPLMSDERIRALYGANEPQRQALLARSHLMNHRWDLPDTLRTIGTIPAAEVERLTGGLFKESVDVALNRTLFDYDLVLILGPVFPHEVVGFSGGNKYLFPGVSGGDFVHFFHWLGAVITNRQTIGRKHTPMRSLIDRAAAMVSVPRWCLAMVVEPTGTLVGLYAGSPEEAWSAAADLSAKVNVIYKQRPFRTVLGKAAEIYDELWVGGKVMYKLEPVVADGGTLIIYAPRIREISRTWGAYIDEIGYHVRDYFLSRMDQFGHVPRGVLAHSTHVRGAGTAVGGVEKPRIEVVLATGIPEDACRRVNLGYLDPSSVRLEDYRDREDEGILFVDHAGEVLYLLAGEERERSG